MTAASDFFFDSAGGSGDPLETRLQSLRWMEAPSDVRERCWRMLDARMSGEPPEQDPQPDNKLLEGPGRCDRHPFRRGTPPRRETLAERWPRPDGPSMGTGGT